LRNWSSGPLASSDRVNVGDLVWLMDWFSSQCNGEWEHGAGITIESIDNPGWMLKIELAGTPLEGKPFLPQRPDLTNLDYWWTAKIEDGKFCAYCGPKDLSSILGIFRSWAENSN
jgi:hypothetical protein